jgi:phosphoglycerol transferase MdoB-like AlkP superfamily enzyme
MWHLVNSVATASKNANPFVSMTPDEARSQVEKIFNTAQNPSHQILRTTRPNIVLIMMESFSADLLGCMGAEVSATPFLDSLFRKGLLFTNIYSSGFRTDQGLASVLSGFPATPLYTIVRFQEKAAKLPSIAKALKQNNYSTTFYYGGESNFRNIKGYCYNTGFDRVVDKQDFNSDLPQSEWGVHDEYALLKQARDLNVEQQPFFSVLLTLSNHEPYLVPETGSSFKNNDESDQMRNSAFYTDQSLKKYFQFCSQQAWFNNTLFVLVADHGHYLPAKRNHATPEAHHIPLLLFGEVIRDEWRGTLNTHTGNHHDIPSTLLTQLSLKTDEFTWSKNLLDSSDTSFAYYQLEDGFGWIENNNWLYYSVTEKRKAEGNATAQNESGMIRRGSAFLQLLYQQFTEY